MTAPIRNLPESDKIDGLRISRSPTEFELYRIITDYEALQDGFLERIEDIETTIGGVELAAGMASGQLQKNLARNPGKAIKRHRDQRNASNQRTFNWKTLGPALEKTGLALVLVVDDARFAAVKEQLVKRRRRNQPAIAGSVRPTWLFKGKKAREMGKKRFSLMTESERKRHQRKAGKASGKARRRKAQHSGALLLPAGATSSSHGQPPVASPDRSAQT